jgi:hypothetical protein
MNATTAPIATPHIRYSLSDLLQFTTVCAILLACHPLTGVASCLLLAGMALALAARVGILAAVLLMASFAAAASNDGARELWTLLIGTSVLGWYRWERWRADRAALNAWKFKAQ